MTIQELRLPANRASAPACNILRALVQVVLRFERRPCRSAARTTNFRSANFTVISRGHDAPKSLQRTAANWQGFELSYSLFCCDGVAIQFEQCAVA